MHLWSKVIAEPVPSLCRCLSSPDKGYRNEVRRDYCGDGIVIATITKADLVPSQLRRCVVTPN
jgi:hypothetical protein